MAWPRGGKRSKFGVATSPAGKLARTVDGILFASQKEARRYSELKMLERAGEIRGLKLQPWFVLMAPVIVNGLEDINAGTIIGRAPVGRYRADFSYEDMRQGGHVVEDVKGMRTETYRWKKKHVEIQYGITVREV
jgi:uncharacterized protein DUF1064